METGCVIAPKCAMTPFEIPVPETRWEYGYRTLGFFRVRTVCSKRSPHGVRRPEELPDPQ
jgi:hypothetical protein